MFPGETVQDDPILLMLDNTRKTHERILQIVTQNPSDLREYITHWAAEDLRSVGDRVQARELEKSLRDLNQFYKDNPDDEEAYWGMVLNNYLDVASETSSC